MNPLGAIILKRSFPFQLRGLQIFGLLINGKQIGEISSFRTHVLLPAGRHRIGLAWPGGQIASNEVEVEVSQQVPTVVEFGEAWRDRRPAWIRLRKTPRKSIRWRAPFSKWVAIAFLIVVGWMGVVTLGGKVLSGTWGFIISRTAPLKVSSGFWTDVLAHGDLTPRAKQAMSSTFTNQVPIDWPATAQRVISSTGTNVQFESTAFVVHGNLKRVDFEIRGDDGIVGISTFLTREPDAVEPKISGFEIILGALDVETYSAHLSGYPRPSILITEKVSIMPPQSRDR